MATVLARYSLLKLHEHFRIPDGLELKVGDVVLLRTKRGTETGQIKALAQDRKLKPEESIAGEVLRKSTLDDAAKARELKFQDVKPIIKQCRALAKQHKLPMRVIAAERLVGGEKLVVYFESEERLDFRDLVKDITRDLNARVELRQVGARDAARLTGDVGVCGQELCCVSYIVDFVPVSMKMAKNQRTSLDPNKISGMCGRLKCCLKYEDDLYSELQKSVPLEGQPCKCEGHDCTACSVDILGQKVTVDFGDGKRELRDVKEIQYDPTWTEKDVRKYQKEMWAKREEERQKRIADGERRAKERTEARDRRQSKSPENPQRRAADTRHSVTRTGSPNDPSLAPKERLESSIASPSDMTDAPKLPEHTDTAMPQVADKRDALPVVSNEPMLASAAESGVLDASESAPLPQVPPPEETDKPIVSESGRMPPPDDPVEPKQN
jgi:cell fate regulator YaaT (PSP1 superfamily)